MEGAFSELMRSIQIGHSVQVVRLPSRMSAPSRLTLTRCSDSSIRTEMFAMSSFFI
jgi:hypothetical protein